MIRQRALTWAAVLALVTTVLVAPLSPRFVASVAALAQDDSAADAGEPTDLAIVALHCAEAPAAEALTAYFSSATPPTRCAPAVGVGITVSENGDPVPGGPFTTDVDGTLIVPVGLGSAIEVREEPKTLPAGYEPLTQEANGVPYANPVRLDSAIAGAAVLFVNVPSSVATTLAQDAPADASEATDLAVVTLQCADAPATEALTSFFSSGTPPSGCSPAAGVTVTVTENEKPLSGSPFRTDASGTLAVRVGLGSKVTVKEDTKTLPAGYGPLTREANGVPYANPVRLDSAVAGAAVLFVNVPTSVAARLNQGTPAVDASEATDLAHAVRLDRTGCDPAYPDERTCIAPGRPLAEPCAITDQRNFTVLAPDPRGLDSDGDGIGCEPISPSGGTILRGSSFNLYTSGGDLRRATPARTGDVAVAASPARGGDGVWVSPPESNRADDWFVPRDRSRAGLWFVVPDRGSTGNLAIVSNPVFIGNGLWTWPNRHDKNDWFWLSRNRDGIWFWPNFVSVGNLTIANSGNGSGNVAIASNPIFISNGIWHWPDRIHSDDWRFRNHLGNSSWFWPNRISVGNLTVAGSGNGNVAIASNPVFISHGVWAWPNQHDKNDWFWQNRDLDGRKLGRFGKGVWGWPSTISVGNLTIAGSGNGNIAIASNPVFIASGVWHWPGHIKNKFWFWPNHGKDGRCCSPNRFGNGVWGWPSNIFVGNLTIARSGSGNVAIVSNPVFISSGVWFVAPDRNHDDHWLIRADRDRADDQLRRDDAAQADQSDVEPMALNAGGTSEAPPSKIEQLGASEQPTLMVNGGLAVEPPPADSTQLPSDSSIQPPADSVQAPSDGTEALPSGSSVESPSDGSVETPSDGSVTLAPDASVQPPADAGAQDPGYVAPEASSIDPSYVDAGNVDAGYVAPDPGIDPSYSAPESGVDPGYVDPDYVDPGYVAPEPTYVDAGGDPGYVAPEPSYVEPSYVEPSFAEPSYVEPSYVDPGYVAPDPGIEPSYSAPEPSYSAPEPNYVAPEPINAAPEPNYSAPEPGYVDAGNGAPNLGIDPGYSGPDPSNLAQESNFVEPSFADAGNGGLGNGDPGNIAADPSTDVVSNVDAGNDAPDSDAGHGKRKRRGNND